MDTPEQKRLRLREVAAVVLAQAIAGGAERCPHPRTSQVMAAFQVVDALMKLAEFGEEKKNG